MGNTRPKTVWKSQEETVAFPLQSEAFALPACTGNISSVMSDAASAP